MLAAVALSVANNVIASVRNIAVELKVGVQVVFHHLKQITTTWQKPCDTSEGGSEPSSMLRMFGRLRMAPAFASISRRSCYRSYRRYRS
jgi:hypothetical protein